jgi:pimeloyl-ACP methyl ester carboxylesterase
MCSVLNYYSKIKQPTLVVNGDNDRMVPTQNSYLFGKRILDSKLIIYKDSGHGGIFQNYNEFVKSVLEFLTKFLLLAKLNVSGNNYIIKAS